MLGWIHKRFVELARPRLEAWSQKIFERQVAARDAGLPLPRVQRVTFESWSGQIYFKRHYLLHSPPGNDGPNYISQRANVFLHHFPENSPDQAFHNHNAYCVGIVLIGGYIETLIENGKKVRRIRRPGSLAFFTPADVHQIRYVIPGTWTLFFLTRRAGATRFYKPDGITVVADPAKLMDRIGGRNLDTPEFDRRRARRRDALVRLRRKTCQIHRV